MDAYLLYLDGRLQGVYLGPLALIRACLTCGTCLGGRLRLKRVRDR